MHFQVGLLACQPQHCTQRASAWHAWLGLGWGQLGCPNYVAGKFYIDDLSLMTGNIEDLQKAFRIIENLCASFGFKVNINKLEVEC